MLRIAQILKCAIMSAKLTASFLLLAICYVAFPAFAKDDCLQFAYVKTFWKDTRPRYIVNYTFWSDGSVSTETQVNEEIPIPVSQTILYRKIGKDSPTTLYNTTVRLCDSQDYVQRIPLFKWIASSMTQTSNYSYTCPLRKGLYKLGRFKIDEKSPVIRFLYRPKTVYTIVGGILEELPNKSLSWLNHYEFSAKIIKAPCA